MLKKIIGATILSISAQCQSADNTSPIVVGSHTQKDSTESNTINIKSGSAISVGSGSLLTLDGSDTTITSTGATTANGISGIYSNDGDIISNGTLNISLSDNNSGEQAGINLTSGASIELNGDSDISIDGSGYGIYSYNSTITLNSSLKISVGGGDVNGIYMEGDTKITASKSSSLDIIDTGSSNGAILADAGSLYSLGTVSVKTTQNNSYGIYNKGASIVLAGAENSITTVGDRAYATKTSSSSDTAVNTYIGNAKITSMGDSSGDVYSGKYAAVTIYNSDLISKGDGSSAVYSTSGGAVNIFGSELNISGDNSTAINADGGSRANIIGTNVNYMSNGSAVSLENNSTILFYDSSINTNGHTGIDSSSGNNTVNLNNSLLNAQQGQAVAATTSSTLSLKSSQSHLNGIMTTDDTGVINASLSNDSIWNGTSSGNINLNLSDSLWNVNGDSSVSTLNNGGAIVFADTSGGSPVAEYNTTLTVTGDYTGSNGYLVTNVDSGTGAGSADQLVINGDATGNTNVGIGKVAATQADQAYIPVVTVDGDASGASFTQVGRASVGGYEYLLRSGDNNGHTVWYLSDLTKPTLPPRSGVDGTDPPPPPHGGDDTDPPPPPPPSPSGGTRIVAPETAAYESNNLMAYRMMFETYHDRTGSAFAGTGDGTGLFLRTNGGRETFSSAEGQLETNSNLISVELGARLGKYALGEGSLEWGVTGTYGHGNSTSTSSVTGYQAKGMTDGYTGGLYATWLQTADENRGAYVDTWAKYGNFQNSVKGDDMSEVTYHTNGFAGSVEGGYTFRAYRGQETSFYIQPQAQMAWVGMDMKDHQDGLGNTVSSTDSGNLVSRAGVRLYWEGTSPVNRAQTFRPYMAFNYINNSSNGGVTYKSSMGQTEFSPQGVTNIGQAKLGVEGKLSRNMTIYASVSEEMGGSGYNSTFGNLGVKATF